MVQEEICFILGAGASQPYGFPLGESLLLDIVNECRADGGRLAKCLSDAGFSRDYILDFANDLYASNLASIDIFLLRRQEYTKIGKLCIALLISKYESESTILSRKVDDSWMSYVYQKMDPGTVSLPFKSIAFITFNYDRSLEFFLQNSLRATYGISVSQAEEMVSAMNIVHMHGRIGSLNPADKDFISYERESFDEILNLYKNDDLKFDLYHESSGGERVAKYRLISMIYKRFYFIGFGYLNENMVKLRDIVGSNLYKSGCVYGLKEAEIKNINDKCVGGINPGHPFHKSLEFIRSNVIF